MTEFRWTPEQERSLKRGQYVTVHWLGGRIERVPVTGHIIGARFIEVKDRVQGVPFEIADPASVGPDSTLRVRLKVRPDKTRFQTIEEL